MIRRLRITRASLVPCVAALAIVALAACTADQPAGAPGATTANASPGAPAAGDRVAVWREFVDCARSHDQNWPDPVFSDAQGPPTFPAVQGFDTKTGFEAVREACGPILDRLPAGANPFAARPVTPEQMEIVRRYSACMRQHPGMSDFPDPDATGSLHIPERMQRPPLLEQQNAARNVCDPILQDLVR